jgi:hypothetical protein
MSDRLSRGGVKKKSCDLLENNPRRIADLNDCWLDCPLILDIASYLLAPDQDEFKSVKTQKHQ